MMSKPLKTFLDDNNVVYSTVRHSPAFTAQEIAAVAHIPGKMLAKTVIIKIDGKLAMVVEPSNVRINLEALKEWLGADELELANELEFQTRFPDCETGAMPPFGNLYDMDVFIDDGLLDDEEIAFIAGSHSDVVKMSFSDFMELVHPKIVHVN